MLVAEARLQRDDGNEALASAVENEIEVLILSMKRLSTVFDTPSSNYCASAPRPARLPSFVVPVLTVTRRALFAALTQRRPTTARPFLLHDPSACCTDLHHVRLPCRRSQPSFAALARTTRTRPPAAQPWRALASATAILIGSAGGARSSARVPISAAVDRSAARFRRRPPRNRDDDDALSTPPFQPASSSL